MQRERCHAMPAMPIFSQRFVSVAALCFERAARHAEVVRLRPLIYYAPARHMRR